MHLTWSDTTNDCMEHPTIPIMGPFHSFCRFICFNPFCVWLARCWNKLVTSIALCCIYIFEIKVPNASTKSCFNSWIGSWWKQLVIKNCPTKSWWIIGSEWSTFENSSYKNTALHERIWYFNTVNASRNNYWSMSWTTMIVSSLEMVYDTCTFNLNFILLVDWVKGIGILLIQQMEWYFATAVEKDECVTVVICAHVVCKN